MKYVSLLAGTLSVLCSSAIAQTDLITNGGFEFGLNGWTLQGTGGSVVTDVSTSHSGTNHLTLLANPNSSSVQEAFQTFTVPSNAVSVTLTYFYNIHSEDSPSSVTAALACSSGAGR